METQGSILSLECHYRDLRLDVEPQASKIKFHHGIARRKKTKSWRGQIMELTGAGFNIAWTTTKAFALKVEARQDDYIK